MGEYYHRMNVLIEKLANQDRPFKPDELGVWTTFVNGLRRDIQIHVRTQAPKPGPVETAVEAAEVYEDVHRLMLVRDDPFKRTENSSTPTADRDIPAPRPVAPGDLVSFSAHAAPSWSERPSASP